MSYCKTCGKQLPPDTPAGIDQCMACSGSAFCAECGKRIARSEQYNVQNSVYCQQCAVKKSQPAPFTIKDFDFRIKCEADGDIKAYLASMIPTPENVKKAAREELRSSFVFIMFLLVLSLIGMLLNVYFVAVAFLMATFAVKSVINIFKTSRRTTVPSAEPYIAAWRHPKYGTADQVQALYNEVMRTAIYQDDVLAFNQQYLIRRRGDITQIVALADVTAIQGDNGKSRSLYTLQLSDADNMYNYHYFSKDRKALKAMGLDVLRLPEQLRPYCPKAVYTVRQ